MTAASGNLKLFILGLTIFLAGVTFLGAGPGVLAGPPYEALIGTEIGDIPADPQELIRIVINIIVGLAGISSLGLLLLGFGKYLTSAGNPDLVEEAKSTTTQAVIGLLLTLLSVFLLRFMGIDLLKLPGLSKSGGGIIVQ